MLLTELEKMPTTLMVTFTSIFPLMKNYHNSHNSQFHKRFQIVQILLWGILQFTKFSLTAGQNYESQNNFCSIVRKTKPAPLASLPHDNLVLLSSLVAIYSLPFISTHFLAVCKQLIIYLESGAFHGPSIDLMDYVVKAHLNIMREDNVLLRTLRE